MQKWLEFPQLNGTKRCDLFVEAGIKNRGKLINVGDH